MFGQPISFTITVSGNTTAGVPSGTVTVYDGAAVPANQIGSPLTLVPSGSSTSTATGTFTNPGVGVHTLTAVYSGQANVYVGSTGTLSRTVVPSTTTTTVTASPTSTAVFGQPMSLTATVTATSGGAPTSGLVTFYDGATTLGTASLSGTNTAVFQAGSLSAGSHTITATYQGIANDAGSTGTLATKFTVTQAGTTTVLNSSVPGESTYGEQLTFTATVSAIGLSQIDPTFGSVTFKDGTTTLATVALNGSNVATYTNTSLAVNTTAGHTITASYVANTSYGASSNSLNQKVAPAGSVTTLTSSLPGGSNYGQAVTFTATVTNAAGGANPTLGTVKFMDGTTLLKSVTLSSSGTAAFTTATLALNPNPGHQITAVFTSSTTNFSGSTSATLAQPVNPAPTSLAVTSLPAIWALGKAITFSVSATAVSGGTPTGTVTFVIDGVPQTVKPTLVSGKATFKFAAGFSNDRQPYGRGQLQPNRQFRRHLGDAVAERALCQYRRGGVVGESGHVRRHGDLHGDRHRDRGHADRHCQLLRRHDVAGHRHAQCLWSGHAVDQHVEDWHAQHHDRLQRRCECLGQAGIGMVLLSLVVNAKTSSRSSWFSVRASGM